MTLIRVTRGSVCCGFVAHGDDVLEAAPWIRWFMRRNRLTGAHALVRRLREMGAKVERVRCERF